MLASDGGAPAPRRPAARISGLLASDGGTPAPRRPAARISGLLASDGGTPAPRRPAARTASWGEASEGGQSPPPSFLVPLALVVDLLGVLGDRPLRQDVDTAAELHDVADGGLERGPDGVGGRARRHLHAKRERVLVALATDDHLVALDAAHPRHDLVGLPGVDEHPAHLR